MKFLTNPVPPAATYDVRVENGVLLPIVPTEEEVAAKEIAREAYERDPERNPAPDKSMEYELFLTESPEDAWSFKRKFHTGQGSDEGHTRFKRVRAYESASVIGSVAEKYDDEVIIADHDGSDGRHQNAAYYYPIIQRATIRPTRTKNINQKRMGFSQDEERMTDYLDLTVKEETEEMIDTREAFKANPYGPEPVEEEAPAQEEEEEEEEVVLESAEKATPEPEKDDDDGLDEDGDAEGDKSD